jgi:hypothetical protein
MEVINDHMASGIYAQISTEVEKQKALGHLTGMSDIEAYRQVGDRMNAAGLFKPEAPKPSPAKAPGASEKPAAAVQAERERNARRKAASLPKPAGNTAPRRDYNPLAMSDEEYLQLGDKRFL